jgi:putative glutamine amidotransferase
MQIINHFFGGQLTPVSNHAGTRHTLNIDNAYKDILLTDVNSYHNWGIKEDQLASKLTAIARDEQNNIEAFYHQQYRISGIMWHPERENVLSHEDALLIERFLK